VKFLGDDRIQHFYDSNKIAGKAIANSVGWASRVAWDIYLFYRPNLKWTKTPPKPKYWMHQLTNAWATKESYRTGEDLKKELSTSMNNFGGG
jgi:hypothetical protein